MQKRQELYKGDTGKTTTKRHIAITETQNGSKRTQRDTRLVQRDRKRQK